jgi:hypothetical protein
MLRILKDRLSGKAPRGSRRSSRWRGVRDRVLKERPGCAVCGGLKWLEVHHVVPFHVRPELELEDTNLIILCEKPTGNCHLIFGHLGNYRSWNEGVVGDASEWLAKVKSRP